MHVQIYVTLEHMFYLLIIWYKSHLLADVFISYNLYEAICKMNTTLYISKQMSTAKN